ncbi:hypothetical protein [Aeromonas sp. s11]|uniref:hypothetical protein n=1 Tax=Aeromonas TaxID=642 RepID=UPI0029BDF34F|nr:hypothetical protein [Aeromonas veronii]
MAKSSGNSGGSKGGNGGSKGGSSSSKGANNNNRNGSSQGASAGNRGSTSNSSSKGAASSKSGGANSSGSKAGSSGANRSTGSMSEAAQRGAYSAGRAAAQAMASGNAKASGGNLSSNGNQGGKGGIASRVSSINQTLSSYGAAPSTPNHNISSIGGPSMYGMHDGSLGGKVKGALGMGPSTNFNETIKTDNVNGVIGNLQRKAQNGTLTARDKANIADASGAFNKQAGANIFGGAILGGAGKAVAGLVGDVGNTDSYFSGIGRDAARGDFDSERLTGQRGQSLGSEGGLDSTLKAAMGFLSGVVPGASQLVSGVASGLTQPASGFGAALNDLNVQAGNAVSQAGASHSNGNGGSNGEVDSAPPRYSLPSNSDLDKNMAGDFNFSPSRFDVTPGIRAQYAWDGE